MGYYTSLDLKASFKSNSIKTFMDIVELYNGLSCEDYMENYNGETKWNKFILSKHLPQELELFLLDYRCQQIMQECVFYDSNNIVTLTIDCDIKNYTDTYNKLYKLLLKCNPIDLAIKERGEDMKTSTIFELQNNGLVKIQTGEYDV